VAEPLRILIVEDHSMVAEGLALALERHGDLSVVGIATTAAEAVRLADREHPRVVLMDYYLPDGSGAEAAADIRRRMPDVAVVMLSGDPGEEVLLSAVEAGASGYVLKTQPTGELIDVVRRVAGGDVMIPAGALAELVRRQGQRSRREAERERMLRALTPREREILLLMTRGLDNRAIARQMVVGYTTVRGHVQSILGKLGAHSRLEAVARAREYRLVD
jgi:DNA-binding NarL/FixJ family response regulator